MTFPSRPAEALPPAPTGWASSPAPSNERHGLSATTAFPTAAPTTQTRTPRAHQPLWSSHQRLRAGLDLCDLHADRTSAGQHRATHDLGNRAGGTDARARAPARGLKARAPIPTNGSAATRRGRTARRSRWPPRRVTRSSPADVGSTLRVSVTATNAIGSSAPATSAPTAVVTSPPRASSIWSTYSPTASSRSTTWIRGSGSRQDDQPAPDLRRDQGRHGVARDAHAVHLLRRRWRGQRQRLGAGLRPPRRKGRVDRPPEHRDRLRRREPRRQATLHAHWRERPRAASGTSSTPQTAL